MIVRLNLFRVLLALLAVTAVFMVGWGLGILDGDDAYFKMGVSHGISTALKLSSQGGKCL
jgi:hypothetical protein